MNADEFLQGQQACKAGDECPEGASESFVRGYGAQHEMEQVLTFKSMNSRYRHKEEIRNERQ